MPPDNLPAIPPSGRLIVAFGSASTFSSSGILALSALPSWLLFSFPVDRRKGGQGEEEYSTQLYLAGRCACLWLLPHHAVTAGNKSPPHQHFGSRTATISSSAMLLSDSDPRLPSRATTMSNASSASTAVSSSNAPIVADDSGELKVPLAELVDPACKHFIAPLVVLILPFLGRHS